MCTKPGVQRCAIPILNCVTKAESILLGDRLNVTENSTENINPIIIMPKTGGITEGSIFSTSTNYKGLHTQDVWERRGGFLQTANPQCCQVHKTLSISDSLGTLTLPQWKSSCVCTDSTNNYREPCLAQPLILTFSPLHIFLLRENFAVKASEVTWGLGDSSVSKTLVMGARRHESTYMK